MFSSVSSTCTHNMSTIKSELETGAQKLCTEAIKFGVSMFFIFQEHNLVRQSLFELTMTQLGDLSSKLKKIMTSAASSLSSSSQLLCDGYGCSLNLNLNLEPDCFPWGSLSKARRLRYWVVFWHTQKKCVKYILHQFYNIFAPNLLQISVYHQYLHYVGLG